MSIMLDHDPNDGQRSRDFFTFLMFAAQAFVIIALLSSCGVKRQVEPKVAIYEGSTWAARDEGNGFLTIFVRNTKAEEEALKAFCQREDYVCLRTPEPVGKVIQVERKPKQK